MMRGGAQCFYHTATCLRLISLSCWRSGPLAVCTRPVATLRTSNQPSVISYRNVCGLHSVLVPRVVQSAAGTRTARRRQRGVHSGVVRWQDVAAEPKDDLEPHPEAGSAAQSDRDQSLSATKEREREAKAQRRATNSAAGMLSRRPHSERELRQKLAEREHTPEAIDSAVQRLQELGMHDNREYAEIFVQSKWRQSRWAPSRIRRELSDKGLSAEDISHGLRHVFGADMRISISPVEEDEDVITVDTRFDPQHHLLEGARRQAALSRGLPPEKRKRRLVMWLQRRGHNWDTISSLLEQIDLS